jgi:hypothetical protein
MKQGRLAAVLALLLFSFVSAGASPLDDKVAALKSAMKDEIAARLAKASPPGAPRPFVNDTSAMYNEQLDQMVNNGSAMEFANAPNVISQILDNYSSDAVQNAGHALIQELQAERQARQDAYEKSVTALFQRIHDAVLSATKPSDLDGLLADLQKYQNRYGYNGYPNGEDIQRLSQQVNGAYQFVCSWQDYLSHKNQGQIQLAQNDLRNLLQNSVASAAIIPRSAILAMAAELNPTGEQNAKAPASTAAEIIRGIKTLDDMEPALQRLNALRQNNDIGTFQPFCDILATYVTTYDNIKAGVPENFQLQFLNDSTTPINAGLTAQLLRFVLSHYFDEFKGPPPGATEKPQAFLNRVIDDAVNREDWETLRKALDVQDYFNRNSTFGSYTVSGTTALD